MEIKLVCSTEDLNELIKHQIVEPAGNGEFILNSKPNLTGDIIQIPINRADSDTKVSKKQSVHKSIDDWYDEYRTAFPIDINKALGKLDDGISLRSGKKDKIKDRLKELIKEGYDLTNVINAVKYEVWFRVNQSKKTGENKLEFMQRMGPWINNSENLDTMIERSIESNEFQLYLNKENNGEESNGSSRKVKIL